MSPHRLFSAKFQPPPLSQDLVPRPRLLARLDRGLQRKLIVISALAGAGKTTLLSEWLRGCPLPSAWLSLDEYDNDLILFVRYLIEAIRTARAGACRQTEDLLDDHPSSPVSAIAATLVSDLAELADPGLVLALDDYHTITEPAVHELVSALVGRLPHGVHLALATRRDPPLPITRLWLRGEMVQVRSYDLRFVLQEARALLQATARKTLSSGIVAMLTEKTEGWAVGLRLAAYHLRDFPEESAFPQDLRGTSSALIAEYLLHEVLNQQPPDIQDFVLRTSILAHFSRSLCEAVTGFSAARVQDIIGCMASDNLFLVVLDPEGAWYRYHHLFRDLVQHWLTERYSRADVLALHARAGAWYADKGMMGDALRHFLAAGDTPSAVKMAARQRHALMAQGRWQQLEQLLGQFSPDRVHQSPELLVLKAWLLHYQGRYAELPAVVQGIEAALAQSPLAAETLEAEHDALQALTSYLALDAESAVAYAQRALEKAPQALWLARLTARLALAGAQLTLGDVSGAYKAVYAGFEEVDDQDSPLKASLLTTACHVHWLTGNLQGLAQAAGQCLASSQDRIAPALWASANHYLGCASYQLNDLPAAERHFAAVVQQPYPSCDMWRVYSASGLALTHQAQGRPEEARAVAESAVTCMLQSGNTALLPVALALEAELAVLQGRVTTASHWISQFEPAAPSSPLFGFFAPHLTLVKAWLAQDTPASRRQAAQMVSQVRAFCESTHTTRFLIEALALQAMLHDVEGDEMAALAALEQAIAYAAPSGFVRLFVDLGPSVARLLARLRWKGTTPAYIGRLLSAFPATGGTDEVIDSRGSAVQDWVEPLTSRESEVLVLLGQHLSNKEIAAELVVSPSTVKTHTLNIYRKFDVRKRQEAVSRALELGIL